MSDPLRVRCQADAQARRRRPLLSLEHGPACRYTPAPFNFESGAAIEAVGIPPSAVTHESLRPSRIRADYGQLHLRQFVQDQLDPGARSSGRGVLELSSVLYR